MTFHVRSLLSQGNQKVGESIHLWGLPAITTCPGRTSICSQACYATKSRYRFQQVKDRLAWNLEQSKAPDFVERMVREIKRKGCLVVRIHHSGDFYDAKYAERWLAIMKLAPRPRYYFYSRSFAVKEIAPVLEAMAQLRCCRAWMSIDHETKMPERIPPNVRVAFLQVEEGEKPELVDLLFRVRRLRKFRIPLTVTCPAETPDAKSQDMNCGQCGRCYS